MRRSLLLAFVVALAAALAVAFPGAAIAREGDYTIDELSTEVTVETNASTRIVERQSITFDTANDGYIWYLHVPEDGEAVRISSIRVAPIDDGGTVIGDWTRLQLVDSHPVLQGHNPGDAAAPSVRGVRTQPWYSFNIGDGMVRCWFPIGPDLDLRERSARAKAAKASEDARQNGESSEDSDDDSFESHAGQTRYVIEADYTISHRVRVYRDVAELYWRYANSSLPVDAYDVNLQVMLPVPADTEVVPNVDVMAWGHGPDGGTLEVGADGTVTCHVDVVERGNYAEAHVIFPSWWVDNVAQSNANVYTEQRQSAAIAEEAQWVDASKRGETWDFMVRTLFMALALVIIFVGVVAVIRFGRSPQSRLALVRVAATLGVVALGAQLFFREPVTTQLLAAFAVIVALSSLMLPTNDEEDAYAGEDADGEGVDGDAVADVAEEAADEAGDTVSDATENDAENDAENDESEDETGETQAIEAEPTDDSAADEATESDANSEVQSADEIPGGE